MSTCGHNINIIYIMPKKSSWTLEAAIAMGDVDEKVAPLVGKMQNANTQYKESSKHVRMHCQAPRPKTKAAPKPGPKAKAKGKA